MTGVLERAADALEGAAGKVGPGGLGRLLADDVAFLRRLDARLRDRPDPQVASPGTVLAVAEKRHSPDRRTALIALGVAFAAGFLLAKLLEWAALTEPRVR